MKNKKIYGILVAALCSAALLFLNTPVQVQATAVNTSVTEITQADIPDEKLYQAILQAADEADTGNKDGKLTAQEASDLDELFLPYGEVKDLTGIDVCTNLTSINLNGNEISDISMLASLTGLNYLNLSGNEITDISALANLQNLKHLYLSENRISNIAVLTNLTNLESLDLGGNQISDISALSSLTKLVVLNLQVNQISDISVLTNLTNLTSLFFSTNQISDIRALSSLTNLKDLSMNTNQISDISALSSLTNLTFLAVGENQISDISVLSSLTNLTHLYLGENQIADITVLQALPLLVELDLCGNQISDVRVLASLTALQLLYLDNNQISDSSVLDDLLAQIEANGGSASLDNQSASPANRVYTPAIFAQVLQLQDIVVENDGVTITFEAGSTLQDTTGITRYDFASTMTRDYAQVTLPSFLTRDVFAAMITYQYAGVLPATATIRISVGTEYAGRELYYALLNADGTIAENEIQQATVDANGYMQVEQSHCSNYIITTIKPVQSVQQEQPVNNNNEIPGYWGETAVVTQQETQEETQVTEEVKSPATGDTFAAPWLLFVLGGTAVVLGQRRRLLG